MDKAKHTELKDMAKKMIGEQQDEIAKMEKLRSQLSKGNDKAVNTNLPGMKESMEKMDMDKLFKVSGNEFDLTFIDMLIPHHQGAVALSQDALTKASSPEIKEMAQKMIDKQKQEIAKLEGWRKSWQ